MSVRPREFFSKELEMTTKSVFLPSFRHTSLSFDLQCFSPQHHLPPPPCTRRCRPEILDGKITSTAISMADGGVVRHFLPGIHAARHLKKLCGCSSAPVFSQFRSFDNATFGRWNSNNEMDGSHADPFCRIGLSKPARDEAKTQQEKLAKLFCAVDLR